MPDESKLPQWAQRELATLRMRNREMAERLNVGPDNSDTFRDAGWGGDNQPLGLRQRIRFAASLDARDWIECRRQEDGSVYVSGSDRIAVEPTASNVVTVRVLQRSLTPLRYP